MNNFPEFLHVKNKELFKDYNNTRVIKLLRKELHDHLLNYKYEDLEDMENGVSEKDFLTENNSFNFDDFLSKFELSLEQKEVIFKLIKEELGVLGWKCELSFGKTALFIYSSDVSPRSCWKDEF